MIGPNGSGKSTFVRTALGLVPPVGGDGRARARACASPTCRSSRRWTPSSRSRSLDFVLMGLQGPGNVTLLARGRGLARAPPPRWTRRARGALARRQLRDLSGGQRQRVLIARALATDADLIFLDEPTTALDAAAEHEVLQLIETLRAKRGAAVVMVTHLVEDGLERADRALLLDRDHGVALRGDRGRGARAARVRARLRPLRRPRRGDAVTDVGGAPSWHELWSNLAIFKDAIWVGGLAGALLGAIGVHVVLRRMVFASSAIAQAAALGVALSFWIPALDRSVAATPPATPPVRPRTSRPSLLFEPVLWAIAASLLATLVFVANPVHLHLTRESLLGLRLPGQRRGRRHRRRQDHARRRTTCRRSCSAARSSCSRSISTWSAAATVVLLGGHLVLWRALLFAGYDPMGARVQGMPVRALNVFLFLSVGLSVALCTRALGALPVFAFSVLPAMTALALTARIGLVFVLATLIGALSGVGGYVVSFRGDLPVGATQTATAAALLGRARCALSASSWRPLRTPARQDDVGAADGRGVEAGAQREHGGVVEIAGAADGAAAAAARRARRSARRRRTG